MSIFCHQFVFGPCNLTVSFFFESWSIFFAVPILLCVIVRHVESFARDVLQCLMQNFRSLVLFMGSNFCCNRNYKRNFQHMLLFWFRKASQNLSLFRQLFYIVSKGGPKEKCWKNQCIFMAFFQHFSFGPPLETMKKKVV